ncbi:MAG: hypothetical protein U0Z53_23805 [Blastocatellia bacterium]
MKIIILLIMCVALSATTFAQSSGDRNLKNDELTQKAVQVFTNHFLDRKKAADHVEELRALTRNTPYDFRSVIIASARMLQSEMSLSEARQVLIGAMEAAAALPQSEKDLVLEKITEILCQMYANDRSTYPYLKQLHILGLPVFEIIASAVGRKMDYVFEMSENNKFSPRPLTVTLGQQFAIRYKGSAARLAAK